MLKRSALRRRYGSVISGQRYRVQGSLYPAVPSKRFSYAMSRLGGLSSPHSAGQTIRGGYMTIRYFVSTLTKGSLPIGLTFVWKDRFKIMDAWRVLRREVDRASKEQ